MTGVQNGRRRRRIIGVAGVLCACVALGGCDADPSTPSAPVAVDEAGTAPAHNDGFAYLTEGSAADEYRRVISEIEQPLPQGEDFPPGLPENFLPTDGYLEQGAARNQAWFTWLCAWEDEYLQADQAQDADRIETAAAMLEWYATAPFYTQVVDDPEGGWVSNVLGPMRLDDASGIRADKQQMCFQYPTVPSSDEPGDVQS